MFADTGKRQQFSVLALVILMVAGLLGYGYYLQYVEYLDPCPLCLTQRFFYFTAALFALLGLFALRSVLWQRLMAALIVLSAFGGIATAGRQIWLQHLPPDQVPECGPGLQYWLANNPFFETLQLLFKGDGNCAEIDWTFLGLSIASWSLLFFIAIAVLGLWLWSCRERLQQR